MGGPVYFMIPMHPNAMLGCPIRSNPLHSGHAYGKEQRKRGCFFQLLTLI